MDDLESCLKEFERFSQLWPGPLEQSAVFNGQTTHKSILFSALIHGDEVGSLPGLLKFMKELEEGKLQYSGRITFVLGNIFAAQKNRRYLETDMNRCFNLSAGEACNWEQERALEIEPLIEQAQLYIDFHQTIEASEDSFHISALHPESYRWAKLLGHIKKFVTHPMDVSFSSAGKCSDEYAQGKNIPALSIELWQKGFQSQASNLAYQICISALEKAELYLGQQEQFYKASDETPDLETYLIFHHEKMKARGDQLKPGLRNLQQVEKNEILGTFQRGGDIKAADSGYLFFPKYIQDEHPGGTLPDNLFLLARKRV